MNFLTRSRRLTRAAAAVALTLASGTSLTACSASDNAADPANIIATTSVWADVASAVTGKDVPAIITGQSLDPHHFEPSAADLAKIKEAGTVVANGGAYDASLYTVAEQDRIIHAVPLVSAEEAKEHNHSHDGHDHDGHDHGADVDVDNLEHAWFSPAKVKEVAGAVAERTGGSAGDVDKRMDALSGKLSALPHVHVAMTEPIALPLTAGSGMHDITPEGYMQSALSESEPSVQDVAAFLAEIESGHLDFLIVNPQSTNRATEQLAKAAKDKGVPIVEIRETPPSGVNFLDYFEQVVDDLADAAGRAKPKSHDEMNGDTNKDGHHHAH